MSFLLLICIFNLFSSYIAETDPIKFYEDLINAATKEAENYKLPTDASRFIPKNSSTVKNYGEFDFIIVGGGVTGSVIANRLSEVKQWKILLLEAGNFSNAATDIPGLATTMLLSDYNWGFYSEPQENGCLGLTDRKCSYPRGCGVGGSSLLNGLIVARGNPADYDNWAALGNPGWSYKDVLPYFLKSEDLHKTDPDAPINWKYHHKGGYDHVQFSAIKNSRTEAFLSAHVDLGYNLTDYNSPNQVGVSPLQLSNKNGHRYDMGTAFIKPVLCRNNLKVLTNSYVTKVDISKHSKTAQGVFFSYNNRNNYAKARREVIISAGSIQTPQILMLSGVGPKAHLQENNITVVEDLNVGSVFKDHACFSTTWSHNASDDVDTTLRQDISDFLEGKGKLTSYGATTSVSFISSKYESLNTYPDLEFSHNPSVINSIKDLTNRILRYTNKTLLGMTTNIKTNKIFGVYMINLHTKSQGHIKLKSNNPYDYPIINPNIFSKKEDIDRLYKAVMHLNELSNTKAFKKINATMIPFALQECQVYDISSKDYWVCVIKQLAWPCWHPVGSCPMGSSPQEGYVVNTHLQVHRIRNLRVADASVLPFTLSHHPMATCMMIGEKASDIIKKQYFDL